MLRDSAAGIGADAESLCRQLPEAVLDGPPEDDAALISVLLEPVGDRLDLTLPAESGSLAQIRGVLALGSPDPDRFHPGMGTLYQTRLAELASVATARFLPAP